MWKSPLGSSSLAIGNSFFDADEKYSTNEARQLFAKEVLKDLSFLYAETDSEVSNAKDLISFTNMSKDL